MSDDSDDDDSLTDSDCEYEMDVDTLTSLQSRAVQKSEIQDTFKRQRGQCRITSIAFSTDANYKPVLVPRVFAKSMDGENHMLVLSSIASMRAAVGMNWRAFARFLSAVGKDAEL